jgi:hypothetical protein
VSIRLVQVAQRFLGSALGYLIHPGQFTFFQDVQFAVQVDRGGDLLFILISFDLASQPPIECKACRSGMTGTGCLLNIVQIQLGLEGAQSIVSTHTLLKNREVW